MLALGQGAAERPHQLVLSIVDRAPHATAAESRIVLHVEPEPNRMRLRQGVLVGLVATEDLSDLRMVRRRRSEIENPQALQSGVRLALVAILEQKRVAVVKKIDAPIVGGSRRNGGRCRLVLEALRRHARRHRQRAPPSMQQTYDRQKAGIFPHGGTSQFYFWLDNK